MNKPSLFKQIINKIAITYGKGTGKMLIHTGVIGWVLSSVAQVFAIIVNEKIPNEQKMFLVPQEIADAVVNILSFYLVTRGFQGLATKLVKNGKILPKAVKDFLIYKGAKDRIGKPGFNVYKSKLLTPSGLKRLSLHRDGVDVVATTIGTVISCNFITPIARNEIASFRQKKTIEKMNKPYQAPAIVKQNEKTPYFAKPSMQNFVSKSNLTV